MLYPTVANWWNRERQTNAITDYQETGEGMLAYIEIPKIEVLLPIYSGTNEAVLQKGVGHLEGTSWPAGGDSSHCVLAAHRGLPSSTLFSDLDQLEVGDVFIISILDEALIYKVDQIVVAKPDEIQYLEIEEGEDYCTLVTCTPYGINSHRLLVRGSRANDSN